MTTYDWGKGEFNPSCVCGGSVDQPNEDCERCMMHQEIIGHRQAVREFNAGWECALEGGTIHDEPSDCPQDNWRNGFLARGAEAEIERLKAERDEYKAALERMKDKWRVADDMADERGQEIERLKAIISEARCHLFNNTIERTVDDQFDCLIEQIDFCLRGKDAEIERLRQWVSDCQSGMYINCVYCGHRYGPQDEVPSSMADVLKEHCEQCPKHPLSHAKAEIERLWKALSEYADHDNWITTGNSDGFNDLCLHDLDGWHIAEQALKKG